MYDHKIYGLRVFKCQCFNTKNMFTPLKSFTISWYCEDISHDQKKCMLLSSWLIDNTQF